VPADYELYQFNFPSEIIAYLLLKDHLTLIVESPTGLAKTSSIHAMGESLHGENVMKLTNIVDLAEIKEDTAWILFDDIGGAQSDVKEFSQWVHIFSPEQDSRIRVLYRTTPLRKGIARVFTTNNFADLLKPENLPQDLKEAIFRRFCYVRLTESLVNPNYEEDKEVLDLTKKPIYRPNNKDSGTNVVLTPEILRSLLKNFANATLDDMDDVGFITQGLKRLLNSTNNFSRSFSVEPNESQIQLYNKVLKKVAKSSEMLNS
jgi:hypothetical protein